MSTPNYGGQPGPNGQFQGQVPQQGAYNPQYQGQVPAPGPNGQFQGQVPAPGPNGQFQGQVPAPGEKKSRGQMAAIIPVIVVAILVVVGGGAFALSRLGGGGYKSPDALAQGIDSAFAKNSLVSLAGAASPEELNAATAWQKDYKHNGGTDWSKLMDLKALKDYVDQIDIKKSEMEYTVDTKSDQVALITITKWEGDVEVKPELADKIREHYKEAKGSDLTANESQAFDKMKQEIQNNPVSSGNVLKNFPNNKLTLVSVKEDGKWYLSGYMTVAEQFLGTGSAQPNYSANFTDVKGASSPEEAVSGMVDALRNGGNIGSEDVYRIVLVRVLRVRHGRQRRAGDVGPELHEGLGRRDRQPRHDVHHHGRVQGRVQRRFADGLLPGHRHAYIQDDHQDDDHQLHGRPRQPRAPRSVHRGGRQRLARVARAHHR